MMSSTLIQGFFISILICFSSANPFLEIKSYPIWKAGLALIPLLEHPYIFVDAVPPPEEVAKLKQKIKKGMELLKDLNSSLESIKESLQEKKEVEKTVLDKIVEVKDEFLKLQVDPGDLPKDLLDNFREKTLEAFKLIMQSYGLDKIVEKQKAQKAEGKLREDEDETDNRVEKERKFEREL